MFRRQSWEQQSLMGWDLESSATDDHHGWELELELGLPATNARHSWELELELELELPFTAGRPVWRYL